MLCQRRFIKTLANTQSLSNIDEHTFWEQPLNVMYTDEITAQGTNLDRRSSNLKPGQLPWIQSPHFFIQATCILNLRGLALRYFSRRTWAALSVKALHILIWLGGTLYFEVIWAITFSSFKTSCKPSNPKVAVWRLIIATDLTYFCLFLLPNSPIYHTKILSRICLASLLGVGQIAQIALGQNTIYAHKKENGICGSSMIRLQNWGVH